MEQRVQGTLQIWAEPFVSLRVPKLFNLRTDPFERADITSNTYYDWLLDNDYIVLAATALGVAVPGDLQGVPAAAEGGELHDRPGGGEARERAHLGPMMLASWNDGRRARRDPRVRRARDARRAGRTTSRPPSASRWSTTTARCGARSRRTSRRSSSWRGCASGRPRTRSWPRSRWSRRCSRATSPPRSRTASRRSLAVLLELDAGLTTEEFDARRRRLARRCRHPRFGVPFGEHRLRADARAPRPAARARVPRLHRHRRRRRVRPRGRRGALRRRRPTTSSARPCRSASSAATGASCSSAQAAMLGSPNEGPPKVVNIQAHIGAARSSPSATAPATRRCSSTRTRASTRRCASSSTTTTRSASTPTRARR